MIFYRTDRFKKDYKKLPSKIRLKLPEVLRFFEQSKRHPSLHVKKMEGVDGIWELRVTAHYRVTYQHHEEGVLLRRIGTHDILKTP